MTREQWMLAGAGALAFLIWRSSEVASDTEDALSTTPDTTDGTDGRTFQGRLTGYWPKQAGLSPAQRKMEGGDHNSRGGPLYTLEDFQRGRAPYVSVSGDDTVFPWGQLIYIDAYPGVPFRVVDTGGSFSSLKSKLYRVAGKEPLDICVDSSSTRLERFVTVTVVVGDVLRESDPITPPTVRWDGFEGQNLG